MSIKELSTTPLVTPPWLGISDCWLACYSSKSTDRKDLICKRDKCLEFVLDIKWNFSRLKITVVCTCVFGKCFLAALLIPCDGLSQLFSQIEHNICGIYIIKLTWVEKQKRSLTNQPSKPRNLYYQKLRNEEEKTTSFLVSISLEKCNWVHVHRAIKLKDPY